MVQSSDELLCRPGSRITSNSPTSESRVDPLGTGYPSRGGDLLRVALASRGQVLERIEPAAPAMLRIAQQRPGAQHPQRIETDDDRAQPPVRVLIRRPQDEAQSDHALDREHQGRDNAQA